MGIKGKMQQKIGRIFSSVQSPSGRSPHFYNFMDAESVAIIFHHESEEQYRFVRDYLKGIKEKYGIRNVMAFAFVDERNPPQYIQSKLEFGYFTRKDVNWQQKPSGTTVNNFINEEYNLLLDFTAGNIPAIRYIVSQSKANCKVGMHYGIIADQYDLTIHMSKKTIDIRKFIEQLNHYLTMINRRSAASV